MSVLKSKRKESELDVYTQARRVASNILLLLCAGADGCVDEKSAFTAEKKEMYRAVEKELVKGVVSDPQTPFKHTPRQRNLSCFRGGGRHQESLSGQGNRGLLFSAKLFGLFARCAKPPPKLPFVFRKRNRDGRNQDKEVEEVQLQDSFKNTRKKARV